MNINDLTVGQLKELQQLVGRGSQPSEGLNDHVGKEVIVRTYSAGNWFGILAKKSGNEVILRDARRMYQWKCKKSIALSGVARHGIDQSRSKICGPIESQWLEAIEIISMTPEAVQSISTAPECEQS